MNCIWCDEKITEESDNFPGLGHMHPECTEAWNDMPETYREDIEIGSQDRPTDEQDSFHL